MSIRSEVIGDFIGRDPSAAGIFEEVFTGIGSVIDGAAEEVGCLVVPLAGAHLEDCRRDVLDPILGIPTVNYRQNKYPKQFSHGV